MAYTVNKTNSSATPSSYTVQDSVVNTQTDLSLIGKGYAGYGEVIAENFLHLLENFSNTSAFVPAGGNVPYQTTAPSTLSQGDLWIDSDTAQLYFYNGTSNVLVGPSSSTGTTNGFIFESILDSGDATHNIRNDQCCQ